MIRLYQRFLRQRFFNRILLTYTLILVATLVFLTVVILDGLDAQTRADMELQNARLVEALRGSFMLKDREARQILQQLYLNPVQYTGIFQLLETDRITIDDEYLRNKKLVDNFLASAVSLDMDITEALIYNKRAGTFYLASRDILLDVDSFRETNATVLRTMDDMFYGPVITPAYRQRYVGGITRTLFTIALNIRGSQDSKKFNESVGVLFLNFAVSRVGQAATSLSDGYEGRLLAVNREGRVLYDSTDQLYEGVFPYMDILRNPAPVATLDRPVLLSTLPYDKLGLHVAGFLPMEAVSRSTVPTRRIVLLLAFACMVVALLSFTWSIRFFSRRVRVINDAIRKLREGDLTQRIPTQDENDEISVIAGNFNDMCDRLQGYINRVYLAELMQKDAVIAALQSQINPHFLYNTLEIIRMEALQSGSVQVGRMIEHLSKLFRSSINTSRIVSLEEELDTCRNYMDLYNIRARGKVDLDIRIPPELGGLGVVKHVLQPILENAVVHGFRKDSCDCVVTIRGERTGQPASQPPEPAQSSLPGQWTEERLVLTVHDNGEGIAPERLSQLRMDMARREEVPAASPDSVTGRIGLLNVDRRLKLLFGPDCGLDIDRDKDGGTTVRIVLPAIPVREMEAYVQRDSR